MAINIIAKGVKGKEYLITDMIATRLNESQFKQVQALNPFLSEYRFIKHEDTDFTWWTRIHKKLTKSKIVSGMDYDIDFYGNVTEY